MGAAGIGRRDSVDGCADLFEVEARTEVELLGASAHCSLSATSSGPPPGKAAGADLRECASVHQLWTSIVLFSTLKSSNGGSKKIMLRRKIATAAALMLTSVAGLVALTAGPAQAANYCTVSPRAGISAVSVRNSPSTDGSPAFTLYSGQYLSSRCQSQSGGYYSACGGGSSWFYVYSGLFDRWVAAGCVRLYVDHD